jgi:ADP-L-glycero-D-manno-heptose 6-epimerase
MRDFIHVDDVVAVNLWFFDHPDCSGLFNLGTGRAQPFNEVALAVVQSLQRHRGGPAVASLEEAVRGQQVQYVDFPQALVGKYQCYTQADLSRLRRLGCAHEFADVATGVARYMDWLTAQA